MENNNEPKFEYDIQLRAQAGLKATFRSVVAAYIVYLGYKLIRDADSSWPIVAGAVFIAAALAFGVYTFRRWRLDLEAARLPDEEDGGDGADDEDGGYASDEDDEDGYEDEIEDEPDGPADEDVSGGPEE